MSGRAAIVLLSGGLDSATAAAWAQREGLTVHALSFVYGQRHAVELQFARALAQRLGLASHRQVALPLGELGGSALTDASQPVPTGAPDPTAIPATYVPARNLVFLSFAAAAAEVLGASDLVIGANAVDYSGYPDCRPAFFEALQATLDAGTRRGAQGERWRIHTPLIELTKAEIIAMGLAAGVPYEWTTSCYDPGPHGEPCDACESCQLRAQGFAAAGVPDPLRARLASR